MLADLFALWDSCAWIGLLNAEPDKKAELEAIYGSARRGDIEIWSSTVAIVEVNRLASEMQQPKPIPSETIAVIDQLMVQPFVKMVSLDTVIAQRARKLIRETPGLGKKPDAIHLATALEWNIPLMHTYDRDDLLHLNGQFACNDGTPLVICEPETIGQGTMFGQAT